MRSASTAGKRKGSPLDQASGKQPAAASSTSNPTSLVPSDGGGSSSTTSGKVEDKADPERGSIKWAFSDPKKRQPAPGAAGRPGIVAKAAPKPELRSEKQVRGMLDMLSRAKEKQKQKHAEPPAMHGTAVPAAVPAAAPMLFKTFGKGSQRPPKPERGGSLGGAAIRSSSVAAGSSSAAAEVTSDPIDDLLDSLMGDGGRTGSALSAGDGCSAGVGGSAGGSAGAFGGAIGQPAVPALIAADDARFALPADQAAMEAAPAHPPLREPAPLAAPAAAAAPVVETAAIEETRDGRAEAPPSAAEPALPRLAVPLPSQAALPPPPLPPPRRRVCKPPPPTHRASVLSGLILRSGFKATTQGEAQWLEVLLDRTGEEEAAASAAAAVANAAATDGASRPGTQAVGIDPRLLNGWDASEVLYVELLNEWRCAPARQDLQAALLTRSIPSPSAHHLCATLTFATARVCHRRRYTPLRASDRVNLVGELLPCGCAGTSHPRCTMLTRSSGPLLVLRPDMLVTGTALAHSCSCTRRAALEKQRKDSDLGKNLLMGSLKHELFEGILAQWRRQTDAATAAVSTAPAAAAATAATDWHSAVAQCVRAHLPEVMALQLDERSVASELHETLPKMRQWADSYLPAPGSRLARQPLPSGMCASTHASNLTASTFVSCGLWAGELRLSGVFGVEEDLVSTTYGLKGKVDAVVACTLSDGCGGSIELPVPLELKTGQRTAYNTADHNAQLLVYTLLLSELYGTKVPCGLLVYPQLSAQAHRGNFVVPAEETLLRSLLMQRNTLVAASAPHAHTDERMPPPLGDRQACGRCPEAAHCALVHAAVEGGDANSFGAADIFQMHVGHLTPRHKQCVQHRLAGSLLRVPFCPEPPFLPWAPLSHGSHTRFSLPPRVQVPSPLARADRHRGALLDASRKGDAAAAPFAARGRRPRAGASRAPSNRAPHREPSSAARPDRPPHHRIAHRRCAALRPLLSTGGGDFRRVRRRRRRLSLRRWQRWQWQ